MKIYGKTFFAHPDFFKNLHSLQQWQSEELMDDMYGVTEIVETIEMISESYRHLLNRFLKTDLQSIKGNKAEQKINYLPNIPSKAKERYENNQHVLLIFNDDSESYAESLDNIENHSYLFGYEIEQNMAQTL